MQQSLRFGNARNLRYRERKRGRRTAVANMSYCRFQNTLIDLRDCEEHFEDELDGEELKARQRILAICERIAHNYGEED
jgi:hypothetical protein